MSYTKTTWRNNQSPAINADNLNHIEQGIYDAHDGLASANNNMELMDNRLQAEIDDANSDISTLESNLAAETSARTQQDSVLSARMDTFTQLPSGSTSGDAELIDIRVGADGTTYSTAGDAVRGQVSDLKSDINKVVCPNLMGNIAGEFYPVYIPAGGKIVVSTSDGSVFATSNTLQIQLRDSSGAQTDYFSLKNNQSYRAITTNSAKADTYYLSWNETPAVPIMVNYGTVAHPYVEYFTSEPKALELTDTKANIAMKKKTIKLPLINGQYYSTDYGTTQVSDSWSRTELYDLDFEGAFFRTSATATKCMAYFYDENKEFLYASGVLINNDVGSVLYRHPNSNVKYVAFSINTASISELEVDVVTADNLVSIEPPYDGFEYLFRENYWMNGSGNMQSTQNFNMVVIPNIDQYTHIFINDDATYNALFYSDTNNLISNGDVYESISPFGRLYAVPNNAKHVLMNMHKSYIDQTNGNYSVYISLIKNGEGLQGKKIACIGDSITWLDGRSGYDGATDFVGYEAELRKRGANVHNLGWSGYPYADLTDVYSDYGIHKQIVTNAVDVSNYDIAILFGGANDMLYSSPLGDASEDYSSPNIDGTTFNGAIGGIINYIRTNNPTCKIYLCTMLPSEAVTRSYTVNKTYRDAVIQNGEFWQVPVIDLYTLMNVHPTINFSDYFYDATHPNVHGMKRIGEIMADFIEQH